MRDVFIPLERFFQQEMFAGRLPAWNPDMAWGYPVIASGQIGFFYPPLLALRALPLPVYLSLLLLGHLVFLASGCYLWFRRQRISREGAYLGAISFTLGSFIFQHLTHLNIIITAAWLPWQLLAVERFFQPALSRRSGGVLLALAIGLPFLAGQLHIPVLLSLVTASYFLWRSYQSKKNRWRLRPWLSLFLIAALAAGLAAAQLFPTGELLLESSRGRGSDFDIVRANQHSFPLYHLPTALFPRFFGNDETYWGKRLQIEYGTFIGSIPLALAIWTLLKRNAKHEIRSTKQIKNFEFRISNFEFFRWLLIISFLLALGTWSPFRLAGLEPSLWFFSAPARWLLFTTFCLSFFAARGLDQLHNTQNLKRFAAVSTVGLLLASSALTALLFALDSIEQNRFFPDAPYYQEKLLSLFASAKAASLSLASPYTWLPLAALGTLAVCLGRRRALPAILAVTTVELIIISATTTPAFPWSEIIAPPSTLAQLPASVREGQARLMSIRRPGDTGAYFTNPESRADAAIREEYRQLLVPLSHANSNIPGVEWPASLDLAGHADFLDALRSSSPAAQAAANIGAIASFEGTDPPHVQLTALDPAPRAALTGGLAAYEMLTPRRVSIATAAPQAGELRIRNSFYPGWRAAIDGQQVAVSRAEEIFQGLTVPAGNHTVDVIYRPSWLYLGLLISLGAAAICAILLVKT